MNTQNTSLYALVKMMIRPCRKKIKIKKSLKGFFYFYWHVCSYQLCCVIQIHQEEDGQLHQVVITYEFFHQTGLQLQDFWLQFHGRQGHASSLKFQINTGDPHVPQQVWLLLHTQLDVQDWLVEGFAQLQFPSATTTPSLLKHCTVLLCVPDVHEQVLVCIHQLQVDQDDQVGLALHVPNDPVDHEYV